METLIGFGVGYLVGTRQGRDGLRTVYESVDAIRTSPEVRQLIAGGVTVAGDLVKQLLSGGPKPMVSAMVEAVSHKAEAIMTGDAADRHAA